MFPRILIYFIILILFLPVITVRDDIALQVRGRALRQWEERQEWSANGEEAESRPAHAVRGCLRVCAFRAHASWVFFFFFSNSNIYFNIG